MPSETVVPLAGDRYFAPDLSENDISNQISGIAFEHPSYKRWWMALGACMVMVLGLIFTVGWLFYWGVGVWGNNIPVTWALDIVCYDWWMGNACGAMIISATLLLLRQYWRGPINRIAEIVAPLCSMAAGMYPIIHLGRSWFFYWVLPYPNSMDLWPQFRSPLAWDAADIISFLVVALLFCYMGLIPDLATLRDRASGLLRRYLYGIAALGWRGSAVHWARWRQAYRILALLGFTQAVCTQCGASVMYAGTVEPGWHSTLLPPFYVINAVFGGIAIITAVAMVVRYIYPMESLITERHLDVLGRLILAAGLLSTYCYLADYFFTSLGGDAFERSVMVRRLTGIYASSFWIIVGAALLPIHLMWFRSLRRKPLVLFVLGILILAGMWGDRFKDLVVTQHRDFLPSSQALYTVGGWGAVTFAGTLSLFGVLLLLALRYLPVASIVESRLLAQQHEKVPANV